MVVVDDASRRPHRERRAGAPGTRASRLCVTIDQPGRRRGAIVSGYRRAVERTEGARDVFVVMAGDGQMDPRDLPAVVDPVARGEADYVKGDRFRSPGTRRAMPLGRRLGGAAFSWMTSRAIGQPVSDSQCGYTAIARDAVIRLDLDALWPRYGYPNDLLSQLSLRRLRIAEVPVRAVYADEVSRLRPRHVPVVAGLVARAWVRRLTRGSCWASFLSEWAVTRPRR